MKDLRATRDRLVRDRSKIQRRVDALQNDERQETVDGQTDNAHEWENADLRDDKMGELLKQRGDVDQALERVDQGTYGICAGCGRPIPDARLDALPSAVVCIECAEREQ